MYLCMCIFPRSPVLLSQGAKDLLFRMASYYRCSYMPEGQSMWGQGRRKSEEITQGWKSKERHRKPKKKKGSQIGTLMSFTLRKTSHITNVHISQCVCVCVCCRIRVMFESDYCDKIKPPTCDVCVCLWVCVCVCQTDMFAQYLKGWHHHHSAASAHKVAEVCLSVHRKDCHFLRVNVSVCHAHSLLDYYQIKGLVWKIGRDYGAEMENNIHNYDFIRYNQLKLRIMCFH